MPRISAFHGIVILMYHNEHGVPHFHAQHGGQRASYTIESGLLLGGELPVASHRLVLEWRLLHEAELMANWQLARESQELRAIEPLQ